MWIQKREHIRATSFHVTDSSLYWFSFHLIWALRQIQSFFPKNLCLCLQLFLLSDTQRGDYTPFDLKYKLAHFIFKAMLPLSPTSLPVSIQTTFQSIVQNTNHGSQTHHFFSLSGNTGRMCTNVKSSPTVYVYEIFKLSTYLYEGN